MKARTTDLTGCRFGRWTVVAFAGYKPSAKWLCRCSCEKQTEKEVFAHNLKNGNSCSCGCMREENPYKKHGMRGTKVYSAWRGIINRCTNQNTKAFKDYGGRGIRVAEEWVGEGGFERFYAHVGDPPSREASIDRIDNNGNYEPGNVRWATRTTQGRNKRSNVKLTHAGKTLCVVEWAAVTGIDYQTIYYRLSQGWSVKDSLETPPLTAQETGKIAGRAIRKNTLFWTLRGETKPAKRWAEEKGIDYHVAWGRIRSGWSIEEALETPVNSSKNKREPEKRTPARGNPLPLT